VATSRYSQGTRFLPSVKERGAKLAKDDFVFLGGKSLLVYPLPAATTGGRHTKIRIPFLSNNLHGTREL
jgi:hypothetical protein